MEKIKRKIVVSSLMAIGFCASLITGATYALFTSQSDVNIAVSSGKVNVNAFVDNIKLYSPTLVSEKGEVINNDNAAIGTTFANGGKVFFSNNNLVLENITPGDKVEFDINIENNSNVTINYRTLIGCEYGTGLFDGLVVKMNNIKYDGTTRYSSYRAIVPETKNDSIHVEIELPLTVGNEYQGKSTKLYYRVEAFQGNVELEEKDSNTYYIYSAYDLINLEYNVCKYDNAVLMNDIDMKDIKYTPFDVILESGKVFTFDGNEHKITNFAPIGLSNEGYLQYNALFASVNSLSHEETKKGTFIIKDLTMDKANVEQNKGDLSVAAVLIGNAKVADVEINNCKVTNSIIASDDFAAGLIGYGEQSYSWVNQKIVNCEVTDCQISGNGNTGALMALSNYTMIVDGAKITSNLIKGADGHSAAAILGAGNVIASNAEVTYNTYAGGGKCKDDIKDIIYGIYHSFGTYEVSGTDDNDTSNESVGYIIMSLKELEAFRDSVNAGNTYNGKKVILGVDIDLENKNWIPIGNEEHPFQGNFDGKDHTIYNLKCNGGALNPIDLDAIDQGFFGCWQANVATVEMKNLKIHNADIYAKNAAGAVVGAMDNKHYQSYIDSGLTWIHHIELTGKVTIEAGNSGSVIGTPADGHWAMYSGVQNITVNVEPGSYVSNIKAVSKGGSACIGGIVACAPYSYGSYNLISNIDVYASWGIAGGVAGVAGMYWKDCICNGNVYIKNAVIDDWKIKQHAAVLGTLAPTRDFRGGIKFDTLKSTGKFEIEYTNGTISYTNEQESNNYGAWAW